MLAWRRSSTRCPWFFRRPPRGWPWIDSPRLAGGRSAPARARHASPHSFSHAIRSLARASAGLARSMRALLTSLSLRRKASRTSSSTLLPRAPSAELASGAAGASNEVDSHASRGGRLSVGCLGRLFLVPDVPPRRTTRSAWAAGDAAASRWAAAAAAAAARRRRVGSTEARPGGRVARAGVWRGAGRRHAGGDGVPCGRGSVAGVRGNRAHRASRAALRFCLARAVCMWCVWVAVSCTPEAVW